MDKLRHHFNRAAHRKRRDEIVLWILFLLLILGYEKRRLREIEQRADAAPSFRPG